MPQWDQMKANKTAGAKDPRVARAREGIERCIALMTAGSWEAGASHKAVGEEFGVSPRTVEVWAANASRIIRRAMGDEDQIRTEMAASLEAMKRLALDRQAATMAGELYPNPDVKAAVAAVSTRAKVLGLIDRKEPAGGESVPADATPEQMLVFVDERIAKLQAFKAQLMARMGVVQALPAPADPE